MKAKNVIYSPNEVEREETVIVEWQLVSHNGMPTLQARNPGGEWKFILSVDRGMLDHTYTPDVRGIKKDIHGYMQLAGGAVVFDDEEDES